MKPDEYVTVMMFGSLYSYRQARGLSPSLELPLPAEGEMALDIARGLDLPLKSIGAIYCNHHPASLQKKILPGDRIAFVPRSVPGPHNSPHGLPFLGYKSAI